MTPSSLRPSLSSETMSSSTNYLPASLYHIYLYRSLRPLTLPCLLPTLLHLSCWWTEDSTTSWGPSSRITLPTCSKQFSSPSQRSSTGLTMAVTRWWRRFRSNQRMGYPWLELLTSALFDLQGTPPLPIHFPPLTLPLIPLPNWLGEPIPSPTALEPHPLFPQENDIVAMLCQLNGAGEGLADKVLLEWTLDVLHSPKDWR